jgi:uncharacterized OB-fold protein
MKFNEWDKLEELGFKYNKKNDNYRNGNKTYYKKVCKKCGELYLGSKKNIYCSLSCINKGRKHTEEEKKKVSDTLKGKPWTKEHLENLSNANKNRIWTEEERRKVGETNRGKVLSDETKKKISDAKKGSKFSEEVKKGMSIRNRGEGNPMFGKKHSDIIKEKISKRLLELSGGYCNKSVPTYDTYAPQIEWAEEVRRNQDDPNILEVKCFKCGEWFVPTLINVRNRVQYLKDMRSSENRFYCSDNCKNSCSIFGKSPEQIIKQDIIIS